MLLTNGVKIDALTLQGQTALHIAALRNQTDAAEVLIKNGSQVNHANAHRNNQTPLHVAALKGFEWIDFEQVINME